MRVARVIKENLYQVFALTERQLIVKVRFKLNLLISFITPIIGIIMPIIIMGQLFQFNAQFGPWTKDNFLIYQFIAYNIILLQRILAEYPAQFRLEKYWRTLQALIIAPFNRLNILLGIFLSHLILISIPFAFFILLCYIYYPISIFTLLFVLLLFFLIMLTFSGIGLILGIFAISREGFVGILTFLLNLFFWFACISYPFEIFPSYLQSIINLNPFYYIFDILRKAWLEDDVILSITSHPYHLLILIGWSVALPIIGVYIFNKIYRKYGIVGY